jgi:hypothetical protein
MSVHWANVGELLESRVASDPRIVAADRSSGSLQAAVTLSRSHSVTGSSCDSRAPSRRYLKRVLGCLRRNRRKVFVAAVTRYLKSVYAAVVADFGDFPRRQANEGLGYGK